jgi:hypothetical protein
VRPGASVDVGAFFAEGYVVLREAVARDVVRRCVDVIEAELHSRAVDPHDSATWTRPVVRIPCPEGPVFATAGTSPRLRDAYDALLGTGDWIEHEGVGEPFPSVSPASAIPATRAGTSTGATTWIARGG